MATLVKHIIILCLSINFLIGQQLPYASALSDIRSIWNPASLVNDNNTKIDLFTRQQWIGFNGAPMNGFLNVQSGIDNKNISLGGFLHFDNTGPLNKKGITGNFAYHLKGILSEASRLTAGVSFGIENYSLNLAKTTAFNTDDPLIANSVSAFFNTMGVGIQYTYKESNTQEHQATIFGVSYNQFNEMNIFSGNVNQKRVGHWYGYVCTHVHVNDFGLEPSLSLNYVNPELSNALFNLNMTYEKFWYGIGYSTVNDIHLQAGFELQNFSEYEANFKLGILVNSGLISDIQNFTPGIELFLRYQINR